MCAPLIHTTHTVFFIYEVREAMVSNTNMCFVSVDNKNLSLFLRLIFTRFVQLQTRDSSHAVV
jgi:hypothetical protein